jgi:hypothetical protein
MALKLVEKVPFEKLLARGRPTRAEREDAFYRELAEKQSRRRFESGGSSLVERPGASREAVGSNPTPRSKVSQKEMELYQRREIGKSLLLLQKHFEQKCKIAGKACDCCEKHPMEIEALAQETLGITGDDLYHEIAEWARNIAPVTTVEASASGQYEKLYTQLAKEARAYRKRVMGTDDIAALMTPEQEEWVQKQLSTILSEGGQNEHGGKGDTEKVLRPGRSGLSAGSAETPRGPERSAGGRSLPGTVPGSKNPVGKNPEKPNQSGNSGPARA